MFSRRRIMPPHSCASSGALQWHDYTGLCPAETMGWGCHAAFEPEDREIRIDKFRKLLSQDGPAECEIRISTS